MREISAQEQGAYRVTERRLLAPYPTLEGLHAPYGT